VVLCTVYRSENRTETYLYLADGYEFTDLPDELQAHFGAPATVMRLKLTRDRKLARVDVEKVMASLDKEGFFLQLPPELPVEEEITRRFS
jgi:uncharacterized protein YcgL (UPF0745 family)